MVLAAHPAGDLKEVEAEEKSFAPIKLPKAPWRHCGLCGSLVRPEVAVRCGWCRHTFHRHCYQQHRPCRGEDDPLGQQLLPVPDSTLREAGEWRGSDRASSGIQLPGVLGGRQASSERLGPECCSLQSEAQQTIDRQSQKLKNGNKSREKKQVGSSVKLSKVQKTCQTDRQLEQTEPRTKNRLQFAAC